MIQCSAEKCTKYTQKGGLCCRHYTENHGLPATWKKQRPEYSVVIVKEAAVIAIPAGQIAKVQLPPVTKKPKMQEYLVDECTKVVQKGGLCYKHYTEKHGVAPTKQCCADECTKIVQQGGFCKKHYTEKHGVPMKRKLCSVNECTTSVQKDGLCKKHYAEKHGVSVKTKQCLVDECTNIVRKGGFCHKHYTEKHGAAAIQCVVDECTKIVRKGGLCRKHYSDVHEKPAKKLKLN